MLVTGAGGFVGRRLVARSASEAGWEVVRLARGTQADLPDAVASRDTSEEALSEALAARRFDAVVHLAAAGVSPSDRNPADLFEANVAYPANLLRALRNDPPAAFVMVGSCSEYAHSDPVAGGLKEDAPLETVRLYGATKAAGTLAASATAAALGVPFACLRAFNIYGPGEAAHRLFPALVKGIAAGDRIALSAGTQVRDFIHVDDVVDALLAVAAGLRERPAAGGIYNLCTGVGTQVAGFARLAVRAARADEALLDFGAVPLRPDDMMWQVGDNSRLREVFGWTAAFTLEEGLRHAVAEMMRA